MVWKAPCSLSASLLLSGNLRSEVPGGEKALVISKFDALSNKTQDLITTLPLWSRAVKWRCFFFFLGGGRRGEGNTIGVAAE